MILKRHIFQKYMMDVKEHVQGHIRGLKEKTMLMLKVGALKRKILESMLLFKVQGETKK